MMNQEEFMKWYQNNEQKGCRLAHLDRVAACNLCYTIGFLSHQYSEDEKANKPLDQTARIQGQ